ncbi:teichoic acid ribitol-phosphate polymerase TarL [Tetragenococcus solitarius]|uniref:CDP-glycerol glycerophosphotransferase family protein n=1 Tax=Tetragenococcus solitarius TaxID=71453 RepID=A0ABN3Y1I2_9ENTE|nr:teichoic acid ribitol-phosphate polymerase TarL [Tetragenococcus solitarius]MDN6166550.1 CDP-glycerol glycerophosphotransferase family protein [Tetragenococcus koreensis]MDN6267980.1 CDP-glycerol glycerophosphotransferase family protein [Tetragenococcus koreensis]MDN6571263.1 CDP-glycerol glycerophosphotransferase family protein [Staphylococcus equorum]
MVSSKIVIDEIYWERVQLFISGHAENLDISQSYFVLRNLVETKMLTANEVRVRGNEFLCRFDVAILDNGYYLPSGQYLLVNKQELDYIAQINPKFLDSHLYELTDEEWEKYEAKETKNGRNNYLLDRYTEVFRQGGNSKKRKYTVKPRISEEVNEFVLDVKFDGVNKPRKSVFSKRIKSIKKKYNKISFKIRNFFFHSIFKTARLLHRKKGNTVLFTSDSRESMSGNFEFVYNEMLRQGLDKEYKIHQIFKPNITERRGLIDKFRFPYLLGKSDYIFVDDFHPLIYKLNFKSMQEIIQVWHAVGAFKTVGFSRAGKRGGPLFDSKNHRNYTKAYVSSETDVPFYAEAFGIKEEYVKPTGVPRTDILFDKEYEKNVVAQLKAELPFINGKKVILFAPTFRGNGHRTAHYPFFKIDFERFARYCEANNAIVLFKMHPFVKNELNIPKKYENCFFDISSAREVNDILFITDILISDYSSLIYEFAVFQRPMLFYAFDLEDYITSRDFYEPYETFVPGKIVETFDELITALYQEDFEQEKVPKFLNKHFKYQDGKSSERLVDNLFSDQPQEKNEQVGETYG